MSDMLTFTVPHYWSGRSMAVALQHYEWCVLCQEYKRWQDYQQWKVMDEAVRKEGKGKV